MMKKHLLVGMASVVLLSAASVYAQAPATPAAATPAAAASATPAAPAVQPTGLTLEQMNKPFKGSFFLSALEIQSIEQALNGRIEKASTLAEDGQSIPTHHLIKVSGVFYRSPIDWVVWMNNQKVTPDSLPPEVVDISVKSSSRVSLKWYDVSQNQVISITLRPHQTYDITTGVLLPE